MSALRDIIEAARADTGESLSGLTALSPQNDPYRLDTPLHHAAEVIAQRWQQYGPPAAHFRQVARRWSLTIGTTVRPEQVVLCLLDLKIVRLAHDPGHRDSLVDLIGYSVVLHELVRDASATRRSAEVAELAEH